MKRIYTYILLMVSAIIFAGCQKDFDGVLTAEMESYTGSNGKIYLNNENFACWTNGEKVIVNKNYECKIAIDGNTATITGVQEAEEYRAVAGLMSRDFRDDYGIIRISSHQPYMTTSTPNGNTVQHLTAPIIAYTTNTTLKFFNLGTLVKITVPGCGIDATLDEIKLIGKEGAPFNADIHLTQEVNKAPNITSVIASETTNANEIFMPYMNLSIGANENKEIYMVLPPTITTTIKAQVTYTVNGVDKIYESKTSGEFTTVRNTITTLDLTNPNAEFREKSTIQGTGIPSDPYQITTANDLVSLINAEGGLSKCYKLMNDIDLTTMTEMNWADFNGFGNYDYRPQYNHPFTGTFDGNGWTIANGTSTNKSQNGIFANVAGCTIKNLKINAHIDTRNLVKGGLINNVSSSTNPTTIENCIVDGSINSPYLVGGLIGTTDNVTLNLKQCINRANITGDNGIGGLIGNTSGTINITDCVNKGDMTAQGFRNVDPTGDLGGLIGNINGLSTITIQNSYVLGTLISNSILGGIIGAIRATGVGNTATITIKNVYIDPDLTQTSSSPNNTCAIVGEYTAGNSFTFNGDNVFVPSRFIQTNEEGVVVVKKLYGGGGSQPVDNLKDNVEAIPTTGLQNLLNTYRSNNNHSSDWSEWKVDVTGNNGKPGLAFENALLNSQTNQ